MFGGSGHAAQGDAVALLAAGGGDVVYLDPPYAGTTGYAAVDALLDDRRPPSPPPTLDALLDAAAGAAIVVLSYGGPAVTLAGLTAKVARHRPVRRARAIPYPRLRSVATEDTNANSREFLVVAGR